MRKVARVALSLFVAVLSGVVLAPVASACDPGQAPCGDPGDTAVCVVEKAITYDGPIKDFPTEIVRCSLRP